MSGDDLDRVWRSRLLALRDFDRSRAPPFDALLDKAAAGAGPRRRPSPVRALAAAVAAAAVVTAFFFARPADAPAPAAVTAWSHWRSPTAILLADGDSQVALGSWKSPTDSLAIVIPPR